MGLEVLSPSRAETRERDLWIDAFKLETASPDEKFGLLIVLDGVDTIPKDLISCLSRLNHALVFQCVDLSDIAGRHPSMVFPPDGLLYVCARPSEVESPTILRERFPRCACLVWGRLDLSELKTRSREGGARASVPRHDDFLLTLMRARLRLLRSQDRERGTAPMCEALYEKLTSLTETQSRMLVAALDGKPNKVIAFEFSISLSTVKSHMSEVLRKLGFAQRASLIARLGGWRTRDDIECRIPLYLARFD